MTNATNPKAVAFFATAVTAVVPSESSAWMLLAVVLVIASCSLAWHAALAMTFSAGPARRVYRSAEGLLTRVVGIVLMLLGIELVVRALELVR
jgi:threonine/homoserine/homoserine lactone efflux protein